MKDSTKKEIEKTIKTLIVNAIKNQLYQHGHGKYRGDYNPKISISLSAKTVTEIIMDLIYEVESKLHSIATQSAEQERQRILEAISNRKFTVGKRLWCIECADRIKSIINNKQ